MYQVDFQLTCLWFCKDYISNNICVSLLTHVKEYKTAVFVLTKARYVISCEIKI